MEISRNKIEKIIEKLENLSKEDYRNFEIALIIFLRSDLFQFKNYVNDSDLKKLSKMIDDCSSLLNLDIDEVDNLLYYCDDDDEEEDED